MLSFLLDLVFPRYSLQGQQGAWITDEERTSLQLSPLLLNTTMLRQRGVQHIDHLVAAGKYHSSPLLRLAIRKFKYGRATALHEEFGKHMSHAVRQLLTIDPRRQPPVLCPVPLHWTRDFQRGFNQAQLLANSIAKHQGWPVRNLLLRTRPTGHQAWRKRTERLHALEDAFQVTCRFAPAHVILIDDLCTTGSTVNACASALKTSGTKRVDAVVLAYG